METTGIVHGYVWTQDFAGDATLGPELLKCLLSHFTCTTGSLHANLFMLLFVVHVIKHKKHILLIHQK